MIEGLAARRPFFQTLYVCVGICLLACALPRASVAQVRSSRTLRQLEIGERDTGWDLVLWFDVPVRYLRHSPSEAGSILRVLVERLDATGQDRDRPPRRDVLPLPPDRDAPVVELAYDESARDGPFVEIQLSREMAFRVSQGEALQSLRIALDERRAPAGAGSETTSGETRSAQLLDRGRRAVRDGELDLAIALFRKVLELPKDRASLEDRRSAQELLALTHERRGQAAHARAEYRAYLDAYPDGPGAARVRQRLATLVTAAEAPMPALRRSTRSSGAESRRGGIETEFFGSLGVTYFRFEPLRNDGGRDFAASDVLTDLDLSGRMDAGDWITRTDLVGTYDVDLANQGRSDDARFSRLSVEVEDRRHGVEVTLGRQGRSDGGVLGRFDGVRAVYRPGSRHAISMVGGLPVESTSDSKPDVSTWMVGGALDLEDVWLEGLSGQLFVIGQRTESMMDRTAVGGELRYSSPDLYCFGYVDYDVLFESLNIALVSGTWHWNPRTDLRILAERRNSPVVTLRSALQGQPVDGLDELRDLFSESEIRDLARDRIVAVSTGSVGVTHRVTDRVQISGDVTLTYSSRTETSEDGLAPGVDALGPDLTTSMQILTSRWLVDRGVGSMALRYFEGEASRSLAITAFSRLPLVDRLRVNPRLRWDYRSSEVQGESSTLVPALEIDWRVGPVLLHADVAFEWIEPFQGAERERETNYLLEAGLRWEF